LGDVCSLQPIDRSSQRQLAWSFVIVGVQDRTSPEGATVVGSSLQASPWVAKGKRQQMTLSGKRILVIGGTSGIGFGAAQAALEAGASVVVASRSTEKIEAAVARLGTGATGRRLDIGDEAGIEALFADQLPFDHVVVTAAKTKVAAIRELPLIDAYQSMNSKFWGAYRIARAAKIADGGSLTFVSGFLSIRSTKGRANSGRNQRRAGRADAWARAGIGARAQALMASRINRVEIGATQIKDVRIQSALLRDPSSNVFWISRPQNTIAIPVYLLSARRGRIPGGMKCKYCP
jgi:hypothetical protein